jgi:hypothetical protein
MAVDSPEVKQGPKSHHSPPSSAKVKNKWSYNFALPYAFMTSTGKNSFLLYKGQNSSRMHGFTKSDKFNSTRKDTNYRYRRIWVTYNSLYDTTKDFVIFKSDIYIYIYMCVCVCVCVHNSQQIQSASSVRIKRLILFRKKKQTFSVMIIRNVHIQAA